MSLFLILIDDGSSQGKIFPTNMFKAILWSSSKLGKDSKNGFLIIYVPVFSFPHFLKEEGLSGVDVNQRSSRSNVKKYSLF